MKINISELKLNESCTGGELLVSKAEVRKTKTGKDYLDMTLTDGRSTINGKMWDTSTTPATPVVHLDFSVTAFNGTLQLNISACAPSQLPVTDFAPNRGYDLDYAEKSLREYFRDIDESFQDFANELFFARIEEIRQATAAIGMHHVQAGGLLQHTYEVVEYTSQLAFLCNMLQSHMQQGPYVDLAVTGALLHDIGKIETYSCNPNNAQFEMSLTGRLSEHLVTGIVMLRNSYAARLHPNIATQLEHIIAAHHGKLEYGSPVVPVTLEAYLVSAADDLSAKLDSAFKLFGETSEQAEFTSKLPTFGRELLTPTAIHHYIAHELKGHPAVKSSINNNTSEEGVTL